MKSFLAIFICINLIFSIGFYIFIGLNGWINFEVGFLSFSLVLLSAYINLKRKIKKEILKTQITSEEITRVQKDQHAEEPTNKHSNQTKFSFSNFILGMQLSVGFFRIFSYLMLILALMILMEKKIFLITPYIVGIGICLIGVATLWYFLSVRKLDT